mgnify:CR=1 FL=1
MLNNIYELLFGKIFTFKGRSSRKEYIFKIVLIIAIIVIGDYIINNDNTEEYTFFGLLYIAIPVILLNILLIQYFPLAVRRLHDFNVSGWWILISFIPCGQLIVFWLIFKKGTEGANNYGERPEY